jgi:tetratricopeptide (TPR) repeat protein
MDNNRLNKIFAESDCITNQMMTDYLEGKLSGKSKNRVEMHLESCEFCKDELEGLSVMKDKSRLSDIIFKLNREITKRTLGRKRIALFPQVSAMAAIILLLVGFAWFFFYFIHLSPESLKQKEIAQALENQKKDELQKYDEETQKDLEQSLANADTLGLIKPQITHYKKVQELNIGSGEKTQGVDVVEEELAKAEIENVKTVNAIVDVKDDQIVITDEKKIITEDKKEIAEDYVSGNVSNKNIAAADSETIRKNEELVSRSKAKKSAEKGSENLYQQAQQAFDEKDYKKALDLFLKSSEKDTNHAEQAYYIGQCYQNTGNNKKAITYYDKVIVSQHKKYLEPALWNKSQIQLKMGQNKQAIESLNQTRVLNGTYAIPAQNQIDSLKQK